MSGTIIESNGTITLALIGSNYFIQTAGGSSVELSYGGAPVVVGQFGAWTPIAAQQTATGYEVALKMTGADQYTVWYLDDSGDYLSDPIGAVSGESSQLESFETSFQYDLNGDGVIGLPPPTVIAVAGSTTLLESGSNYLIQTTGGSTVQVSYGGAAVVAGQFGGWTPIAAQQTASGYELALKLTGADQYTVWYLDTSGNYVSSPIGSVTGESGQLELFETSFQYDLNGDGIIGLPAPAVIAVAGATSLLESGSDYFIETTNGSTVELSSGGTPVAVGQLGGWTLIAAQQTGSGYELALALAGADEYTVWYLDNSGNYLSSPIGTVSGESSQLESMETGFQYDLNGDGIIGLPPPTVIATAGSISLLESGSNYLIATTAGPTVELMYNGAPVVAGQFGAWTPIAAQQTASGYELALKVTGADQYTVFYLDGNGNYLSDPIGAVSGESTQLEVFETSFQYDLNGDGRIGPPPPTLIATAGSTSLLESGSNYLIETSDGPTVELGYGGAPIVVGQFDGWTPIVAQKMASGYELALALTGADEYTVWYLDNSGNYLSDPIGAVSGESSQLESFETSFQYDLNGDGIIGLPPPTVIAVAGSTTLLESGSNYLIQTTGGSTVEVSYGEAPIVAGQFGGWTPIAAQQTASGYELALKLTGADQYTVWYLDTSGNYVSSPIGNVTGESGQLESMETSFQYDLNGDGIIGLPPPTVIATAGSTTLLQSGSNYLVETAGGSTIELMYNGAPVVAGEFGTWIPIAAQQTATGYEVALKQPGAIPGADQYTIWYTDSSGNYLSSPISTVLGPDPSLESFETSFQYDLNGDGTIGIPQISDPNDTPSFIYNSTDANGIQLYEINWNVLGSHPFAVYVLNPTNPSPNYQHSFLFALPPQPGLDESGWGVGIDQLQQLNVANQYNATIIEPVFPLYSWYADNPNDPTMNYETFTATYLTQWVDSTFATTGAEKNLLLGFSKSGYGALDLLFKHPAVFSAAAAWDFPADMPTYNAIASAAGNYGTDANFQANYRLDTSFIDQYEAPFLSQDRIWISGYASFEQDVSDFNTLLTSQGVAHTLAPQTPSVHAWQGNWLPEAVSGLYGLAQNLTG